MLVQLKLLTKSPRNGPWRQQVTTEEDLEIIFSRFGNITSCDIIRDYKTGLATLSYPSPSRSGRCQHLCAACKIGPASSQRHGACSPRCRTFSCQPAGPAGDSLCYAFIGFDTDKASEDAYFKMNNVLIDDRRIKARSSCYSSSM